MIQAVVEDKKVNRKLSRTPKAQRDDTFHEGKNESTIRDRILERRSAFNKQLYSDDSKACCPGKVSIKIPKAVVEEAITTLRKVYNQRLQKHSLDCTQQMQTLCSHHFIKRRSRSLVMYKEGQPSLPKDSGIADMKDD